MEYSSGRIVKVDLNARGDFRQRNDWFFIQCILIKVHMKTLTLSLLPCMTFKYNERSKLQKRSDGLDVVAWAISYYLVLVFGLRNLITYMRIVVKI